MAHPKRGLPKGELAPVTRGVLGIIRGTPGIKHETLSSAASELSIFDLPHHLDVLETLRYIERRQARGLAYYHPEDVCPDKVRGVILTILKENLGGLTKKELVSKIREHFQKNSGSEHWSWTTPGRGLDPIQLRPHIHIRNLRMMGLIQSGRHLEMAGRRKSPTLRIRLPER